ncbi:MAG: response regulator [Planctomycetes bacterium]|nr:response regulator [Planctomycetota bacterium]
MTRRLVLAEDDPHIGVLVAFALEPLGLVVERFADGEAALARLRAGPPPALVVLDLMLPRLSGRDVLRALEADPALDPVPVLVLSARAGAVEVARARGALAFLAKPFDVDDLLRTVEELLA